MLLVSCLSPEAVKTEIQGVRNDMGSLENLIDQKADATVVAENIEDITCQIEQVNQVAEEITCSLEDISVWKNEIQAETINYNGAGWVVIGSSVIVIIFVGAGLLLIRAFMKRGDMLRMLTSAVKKVNHESPEAVRLIKHYISLETTDGKFSYNDKQRLAQFTKKYGTFLERERQQEV